MTTSRDDEVTWHQALGFLWPHWQAIGVSVLGFTLLSIALAFTLPNRYTADMLIVPVEHSAASSGVGSQLGMLAGLASVAGVSLSDNTTKQVAISTLDSRALVESLLNDENLLPLFFRGRWDAATHSWKRSFLHPKNPTLYDGYLFFTKQLLTVKEDKVRGFVLVAVRWTSPEQAEKWVTELVSRTNELLRQKDLDESNHRLAFLNEQVAKTNDVDLKKAIYLLIQQELKQQTVIRGDDQYAFRIVDPAVVPERKSFPNRLLITILGGLCGLLVGIAAVVMRRKLPAFLAGVRQDLPSEPR